jgi:hypothetical protein
MSSWEFLHCFKDPNFDATGGGTTSTKLVCGTFPNITSIEDPVPVKFVYEVTKGDDSSSSILEDQLPLVEATIFLLMKDELSSDAIVCCYGDEQQQKSQTRRRRNRRDLQVEVSGKLAFSITSFPGFVDRFQPQCQSIMNQEGTSFLDDDETCYPVIGQMQAYFAPDEDPDINEKVIRNAVKDAMSHPSLLVVDVTNVTYIGLRMEEKHDVMDSVRTGAASGVFATFRDQQRENLEGMGIFVVIAAALLSALLVWACLWRQRRRIDSKRFEEEGDQAALEAAVEMTLETDLPPSALVKTGAKRASPTASIKTEVTSPSASTSPESPTIDLSKSLSICQNNEHGEVELELDFSHGT